MVYVAIPTTHKYKIQHIVDLETILNTSDTDATGYIVEVDIEFPIDTHEQCKEYPICPEPLTPNAEWFSKNQRHLKYFFCFNFAETFLLH